MICPTSRDRGSTTKLNSAHLLPAQLITFSTSPQQFFLFRREKEKSSLILKTCCISTKSATKLSSIPFVIIRRRVKFLSQAYTIRRLIFATRFLHLTPFNVSRFSGSHSRHGFYFDDWINTCPIKMFSQFFLSCSTFHQAISCHNNFSFVSFFSH